MTQAQWVVLLSKIALISGALSIMAWVAIYSWLAPWWRSALGRALVFKSVLIGALMAYATIPMFVQFTRLEVEVYAWAGVGLMGLVTPAMAYRTVVWLRLHKAGRLHRNGETNLGGV